jgi:hypothetical protein
MPSDRRVSSRKARLGPLLGVAGLMAGLIGFAVYVSNNSGPKPEEPIPPRPTEPPPLTATRFLNTTADAKYVGADACVECHAEQFASYHLTAHSKALSPVDPAVEPADGEFYNEASRRHYRIYRRDGQLRQQEYMADEQGVIAQQDHAMDWLIGSGRHSRSYLVDIDGFLVESPVTWYSERQKWDMSPGFDRADNLGFERAADEGCVFCHVGLAVPQGDSLSKLEIRQQAISCERCHGPGSLHVERRRAGGSAGPALDKPGLDHAGNEAGDPTIVNPARLDRRIGEDICAQCHLRGDATATIRGRRLTDFRPGLPLTDFRIDYHVKAANAPMKVVGHVEQMRLSRCWTAEGSTLTCTTCHDPHQDTLPQDKVAFYRAKCLECHTVQACGLPETDARRVATNDHCAGCHMPQVETDIPHIAFTHHRIGIHNEQPPVQVAPRDVELIPASDVTYLPEDDRERCLGLAYLEYSARQRSKEAVSVFQDTAWNLLKGLHDKNLYDAAVESSLARLLWEKESDEASAAAYNAVHGPNPASQDRINAAFVMADMAMKAREFEAAQQPLRDLIQLRRHSEDHLLLSICLAELGKLDEALAEADLAISIQPFRPETYELASRICEASGKSEPAQEYAETAQRLRRILDAKPAETK